MAERLGGRNGVRIGLGKLLVIVLVGLGLGLMTYSYLQSLQKIYTSGGAPFYLRIDTVYWMKMDGVRNTLLVTIRNYGPREETVSKVFAYTWPNGTRLIQDLSGGGLLIPPNTIANLTFATQGFTWEKDTVYSIGVTTPRGFTIEATFRSSKDP